MIVSYPELTVAQLNSTQPQNFKTKKTTSLVQRGKYRAGRNSQRSQNPKTGHIPSVENNKKSIQKK